MERGSTGFPYFSICDIAVTACFFRIFLAAGRVLSFLAYRQTEELPILFPTRIHLVLLTEMVHLSECVQHCQDYQALGDNVCQRPNYHSASMTRALSVHSVKVYTTQSIWRKGLQQVLVQICIPSLTDTFVSLRAVVLMHIGLERV